MSREDVYPVAPRRAGDLGPVLRGDAGAPVEAVCRPELLAPGRLAFVTASRAGGLSLDAGGVVLCPESARDALEALEGEGAALVLVPDPMLAFVRLLEAEGYSNAPTGNDAESHGHALAPGASAYIERGVSLGRGVEIFNGASLMAGTVAGERCRIQPGACVGGPGLGYARDGGRYVRFPHLGGVLLGDDVDVGPGVSIAKGILQDTVVGAGTKIAAGATIGHNCSIGRDCFISAGATLAGSVTVGDGCWIAPNATVLNGVSLAPRTQVGIGAVIFKDTVENHLYLGNPARSAGPRRDQAREGEHNG